MERMGIPGEQAAGVIDALRFIERYKTLPDFSVGKTVVVIGGGNTAIDAANAARRLGAQEVHLFYRRTEKEMPAFSFEYDHSKVEGVHFHWLAQPVAIIERDGRAAAVRFVRTALGEPDASGRRKAEPVPGSEFDFPCDLVIPALGQSRLTSLLETHAGNRLKGGSIVGGSRHRPHRQSEILRRRRLRERRARSGGRRGRRQTRGAGHRGAIGGEPWLT